MSSEALNASVMVANEYSSGSRTDKIADDQNQLMMQIHFMMDIAFIE